MQKYKTVFDKILKIIYETNKYFHNFKKFDIISKNLNI